MMQKCIKIFFTLGGGPPDWLLTEKFSIIGVGGGVNPMMENSITFLLFFLILPLEDFDVCVTCGAQKF